VGVALTIGAGLYVANREARGHRDRALGGSR
jgi:hypothetical protein